MNWLKHIGIGAPLVVATLYFGPVSGNVNYAIATHNVSDFWMRLFSNGAFLLTLPGLIIAVLAPVFVVSSLIRARWQRDHLRPSVGYVALIWLVNWVDIGSLFAGINVHHFWPQRKVGLEQAARRAQPLIDAIDKHYADTGKLPDTLSDLVPRYISAIPATGMTAYPNFLYSGDGPREGYFQSYELRVHTGFGFAFDSFNYWPEGNYPARMYGGRVERVGVWAYVHE